MIQHIKKFKLFSSLMGLLLVAAISCEPVLACTRTLYVSADGNVVITGRNMDWKEDMGTNLWVFPAGMKKRRSGGQPVCALGVQIRQHYSGWVRCGHSGWNE